MSRRSWYCGFPTVSEEGVRRLKAGGFDFNEAMEFSFPDGPRRPAELFDWSDTAWRSLESSKTFPARRRQLEENLQRGFVVRSYYSGKGDDATVGAHLTTLFQRVGSVSENAEPIKHMHASDKEEFCLQILLSMKFKSGAPAYHHIFGNMLDRLKPDVMSCLNQMLPGSHWASSEKAKAYETIGEYLANLSLQELYNTDTDGDPICYCLRHRKLCKLYDSDVNFSPSDIIPPPRKVRRTSSDLDSNELPHWEVWVAGSCCEDFARYGSRLGPAGHRMLEWHSFCREVLEQRPAALLFEISDTCPLQMYEDSLPGYELVSAIVSPNLFGWPARRPRRYTVAWNPEMCELTGCMRDYVETFGLCPALTGDDLFLAPKHVRDQMMIDMARRRGHMYANGEVPGIEMCLTAKELARLQEARERIAQNASLSGVCLTDVEQNQGFVADGPLVPTLVRHGKIYSLSKNLLAHSTEHLGMMGEALFDVCCASPYQPLIKEAVGRMTDTQIRSVAGAAMHVVNIGTLMLYLMTCLAPKSDPTPSSQDDSLHLD